MRIGVLLPRSSEFPSMAFDLLDGIRIHSKLLNQNNIEFFTQNIGFGDDSTLVHGAAEKMILENNAQLIVAYATSLNAELLYSLAETSNVPFLFLDAGMEFFEATPHPKCFHITLQGLQACLELAKMAGDGGRAVFSATSFLDGGYRSIWAFEQGLQEVGGNFSGHFIGHYQPKEFTLEQFNANVNINNSKAVLASFSSYLNTLFLTKLKDAPENARSLPFYCLPFMADEQLLGNIPFPGGTFHTMVPWATSLSNELNVQFQKVLMAEKNKNANIFHLLGWEAAIVIQQIVQHGIESLAGWSYQSPRGEVTIHPETHCAFAPLYKGEIVSSENGKCELILNETFDVLAEKHNKLFGMKPSEGYSRWRNNYFCI